MAAKPDAAAAIKQIYFQATKATIARDVERAIALLISLDSEEAREQVAVYMDGLAQMRSEWGVKSRPAATAAPAPARTRATAAAPTRRVKR